MLTRFIAGLLASLLPLLVQADVYKWVDAEGRTHYSNVPPKNVKTRRVEAGGVTVVPALVVPPAPVASVSAPLAVASAPVAASAPAVVEPEARVSAPLPPVAAASAGGERAKSPGPVSAPPPASASEPLPSVDEFKPMPGWSQPPIRPRGNSRSTPADETAPAPRNKKSGSAAASLPESPAASNAAAAPSSRQD
jgi:hypothetical protein